MSTDRKHNVGLLILFGPEARSFIYSKLVLMLAEQGDVTIFTNNPDSRAFNDIPKNVKLEKFYTSKEHRLVKRIRNINSSVFGHWRKNILGVQRWKHYIAVRRQKHSPVKDTLIKLLISNRVVLFVLRRIEALLVGAFGTDKYWKEQFERFNIHTLICATHSNEQVFPILQTAENLGVRIIITPNSPKDVYVNSYFHIYPSILFAHNSTERLITLRSNPGIKSENIRVSESLHILALRQARLLSKEDYYKRLGLNIERPIICYTAASPLAVRNEEIIVRDILLAIRSGSIVKRPQLILRLNPMESGARFEFLDGGDDLIIQKPSWEWFPNLDWCCPLPEDLIYWASTIFYASVNISVASTVTAEFLVYKRPVVNICFDVHPVPDEEMNARFWHAEHYKHYKENKFVHSAFSLEHLVENINSCLVQTNISAPETFVSATALSDTGSIVQTILQFAHKEISS